MKVGFTFFPAVFIGFMSAVTFAHEQHDEMKAVPALPGVSIFHLDSSWRNQKSQSIKISDLRGKSRLMVMLYTKCETACPLIVEDLRAIAAELEKTQPNKIQVSIFSIDAIRETPESLAAFAVKRKLPPTWELFTAKEGAVAELAAALGLRYKRLSNGDYIHSNVIYFLNGEGEVLAQKEGLSTPRNDFLAKIRKTL